jgi:hypothetical protein
MFGVKNDSWARIRRLFADQFEPDGDGFIYRRSQKGEAIRVTSAEHQGFIDQFNRQVRYANWSIYIGVFLALGAAVLVSVLSRSDSADPVIYFCIALGTVPYFILYYRAWAAPARELEGRMPIAGALSTEEVRRLTFGRISYGKLAAVAAGGIVLPFFGSNRHDVFSGWNRLWLVLGAALVLLAAVQAFRKWRFEAEDA